MSMLSIRPVIESSIKGQESDKHLCVITTPDDKCAVVDRESLFDWLIAKKIDAVTARRITDLAIEGYEIRYYGQKAVLVGELAIPIKWQYP